MNPSVMDILIRVWDAFRAKALGAAPRVLAALVVLGLRLAGRHSGSGASCAGD